MAAAHRAEPDIRGTSIHTFPTHRSTALRLFESLHPHLYQYSSTVHSLCHDYSARLSNSRHTADCHTPGEYELHLRQQAFDTLWLHPLYSDRFRVMWDDLVQHSAAVPQWEWEETATRLHRRWRRRLERAEAEMQRRMAAERAFR